MQIIKYNLIATIRDDEEVDRFFEKLNNHLSEIQDITYNISLSGQEVKHIKYHDPVNCGRDLDVWNEMSTQVIDDELTEPAFRTLDKNRYVKGEIMIAYEITLRENSKALQYLGSVTKISELPKWLTRCCDKIEEYKTDDGARLIIKFSSPHTRQKIVYPTDMIVINNESIKVYTFSEFQDLFEIVKEI